MARVRATMSHAQLPIWFLCSPNKGSADCLASVSKSTMRTLPRAVSGQMRALQIPIVFIVGVDPVRSGLVASMNRPGGNMTGIFTSLVRRGTNFGLLHELVPDAKTVAMLVDLSTIDSLRLTEAREAATMLGVQLRVLVAGSDSELDSAFATLNRERADAMVVTTSPFFVSRAKQIVALVARDRVPAIYDRRQYAEAGGLMSYAYDLPDGYRQMGNYAARILTGTKPADLPVLQPTKFELVINLKTAKALGLEIPATFYARADEVIE
jgi:putative ABC transport system substrate-binding protein